MKKKCGIIVVKTLRFSNFLDLIWTWTLQLKIFWTVVGLGLSFEKIWTGSGSQNMTVCPSLV